jgi:ABC-type sugar transport system ATPase subunit
VKDACLDRGMGVVWVGTDFAELAEMCDQVLVLAGGRVVRHLQGDKVTKSAIDEAVLRTANRG